MHGVITGPFSAHFRTVVIPRPYGGAPWWPQWQRKAVTGAGGVWGCRTIYVTCQLYLAINVSYWRAHGSCFQKKWPQLTLLAFICNHRQQYMPYP